MQDIVDADAPKLRERVQVICAQQGRAPLPVVDALRAAQSKVLLQNIDAVPLFQTQAADVPPRGDGVDDGIARQLLPGSCVPSVRKRAQAAAGAGRRYGGHILPAHGRFARFSTCP